MYGIAPKQKAFKFKIAPHKQKSKLKHFLARRWGPLANEALCLSTHKHNGKSGISKTVYTYITHSLRVPLVVMELLTLPEHLFSSAFFSKVWVTQSLAFCALFCYFIVFLINQCIVCPSSIYGVCLPIYYLQTWLSSCKMHISVWLSVF